MFLLRHKRIMVLRLYIKYNQGPLFMKQALVISKREATYLLTEINLLSNPRIYEEHI